MVSQIKPIKGKDVDPLYNGIDFNTEKYEYNHDKPSWLILGPSGGGKEGRGKYLLDLFPIHEKLSSGDIFRNKILAGLSPEDMETLKSEGKKLGKDLCKTARNLDKVKEIFERTGIKFKDKDQALKLLSVLSTKSKSKHRQIIMLTAIHGPYKGHKFVFSLKVPIIIGREQAASISLADDQFVSRRHSTIYYEDGHFVLKDTNSKNGTFVNGNKVVQIVLEDNDIVTVGNTHLKIFIRTVEGYLINKSK